MSPDLGLRGYEGWVPGGDPGPGPSPPQVAFSRAGAIQRLGGRSIRRTCGLPSQFLNTATRYTDESAVAIRSEFLAKGNYANSPDSRIDLAILRVRVTTAVTTAVGAPPRLLNNNLY